MQLATTIRDYYFAHLSEMNEATRFHFCTRLAAWEGDERALAYLREARPLYVPEPLSPQALEAALRELIEHPPAAAINAGELRATYFEKYPQLRGLDFALFRVRHLQEVYGVDARAALFACISRRELLALKTRLLADDEAMRILSTYAINYLYLLERVMLEHADAGAVALPALYELGQSYEGSSASHSQLLIYFYTHCIIGESNFYAWRISSALLPTYRAMLGYLEQHIVDNYDQINLDNKLEFLVCCRICEYDSPLFARTHAECEASVSPDGTFLVDTHNTHAQQHRRTLETSEHRNVLYILSTSAYSPQPIQLTESQ